MMRVVLYGREGCCLCDEARAMLLEIRERQPFVLEERDIEGDDELLRRYLERIPVIAIDGVEVFELIVDRAALERRLAEPPERGLDEPLPPPLAEPPWRPLAEPPR